MPMGGGSIAMLLATGQTDSASADINGFPAYSIWLTTLGTASTLKLQVSRDNVTWCDVMAADGSNPTACSSGTFGDYMLDSAVAAHTYGARYLRIVLGTAQAADKTFYLYTTR